MKRIALLSAFILMGCSLELAWADASEEPQPTGWMVCPSPSALVKDPGSNTWSAPHSDFKSYEISFVNQVTRFLGAQWSGVNVGQVICVYEGNIYDFPVQLSYGVLTLEPIDGHWQSNQGGYRNCQSQDPNDCPFQVNIKPKAQNIYQEAMDLRQNVDNSAGS